MNGASTGPQPGQRLSLFTGADARGQDDSQGISRGMTLPDFYAAYVLPIVRRLSSPKTIEQDRNALRRWAELTPNPALDAIDDALAADFVDALAARTTRRGTIISPNTVRKTCTHLQLILDCAGPKTRRRRRTAQLLDAARVPYFERPPESHEEPSDIYTLDEIGLWLDACSTARRSMSLPWFNAARSARWWRALVIFAYNTGLRIETTMGATWDMIDRDPGRPGWMIVPAAIAKGQRGGRYYVNRAARAAIESLGTKGADGGQGNLFPWRGWPRSATWLHASRRNIQSRSQLPPARRIGFHGLRKALATWLAARNPMVASIVLGHRGGVTQRHYVDPVIVAELLEQVPQPPVQCSQDARQPLLF